MRKEDREYAAHGLGHALKAKASHVPPDPVQLVRGGGASRNMEDEDQK